MGLRRAHSQRDGRGAGRAVVQLREAAGERLSAHGFLSGCVVYDILVLPVLLVG